MKVYLTERPNGLFLLTAGVPMIKAIRGTDKLEAWVVPGDPIGLNNLCRETIKLLVPDAYEEAEPLVPQRIELSAALTKPNTETH